VIFIEKTPVAGIDITPAAIKFIVMRSIMWIHLPTVSQNLRKRLASSLAFIALLACLMPTAAQAPIDLRVALVIGNAAYPGAAALANPGNDAKAMGATLRSLGFTVVETTDASRAQMQEAITKVRDTLRGKSGVGMLYYAGHGLQLDWRNYMVPIDAKLSKASDVPEQTVELGAVIDAFKQAGNRMNIVVLDACRDNPFAGTASAKGLAQLDAPPGTFLAFATAPGNVAEDGDAKADSNGLYTRFLLQELKKPQAKIEDVFKRVRLNVRQQSQGRQIPWESTSLEDDFFFNSGIKQAITLSNNEKERAFNEEKAEWDKIKDSKNVNDFYAFLQKYPNGSISEAVTHRLNVLNKPQIAATPVQGRDPVDYAEIWKVGNSSTFVRTDLLTKVALMERSAQVTKVTGDVVEFNGGQGYTTLTGGTIRTSSGANFDPPIQSYPAGDFQIGQRWSSRSIETNGSYRGWIEFEVLIASYEDVTVKLGTYKAYKMVMKFSTQSGTRGTHTMWFSPKMGMVKFVRDARRANGQQDGYAEELIARNAG
jgi:Caspase domain